MPEGSASQTLEANLSALAVQQPALADSIRRALPDPRLVFQAARNGLVVPGLRSSDGTVTFHSLYDPRQESGRFAESFRDAGCVVVSGLGAGYHVAALLARAEVGSVVVIEKDAAVLRSLFEHVPLEDLLRDPRLCLAAGVGMVRSAILASWQPAVMGGLRSAPLRPWCDREPQFFDAADIETKAAIDAVRADYGVQSHFGKRWFANIILNLAHAAPEPPSLPRSEEAIVTAAGPSLELGLARLARERVGRTLVATDTSLPALLRSGIVPDAVLSIDCQNHGYHHFLQGKPPETMLFLDLASPPLLARQGSFRQASSRAPVFVASAHPFARYVASHWLRLPLVDMSGGNVTHAAVSLARVLGARRIVVYGADFCYPEGKAYARGTYLYDYFWSDQSRVSPAETRFFSFVFGSVTGGARREMRDGRAVYSTPVLDGYRDRFRGLVESLDAEVIRVQGGGPEVPLGRGASAPGAGPGRGPSPGPDPVSLPGPSPARTWTEFLADYSRKVEQLPLLSAASPLSERELWFTLLPVAARVVKEGSEPGPGALEEARRWSLERIQRALRSR